MPISYYHGADPAITGQAAYESQEAIAAAEQQRYYDQLDQRERLSGQDLDYRYAMADFEGQLRDREPSQRAYQYDAGLGLQYDQLAAEQQIQQQRNELAQQEVDQRQQASEAMLQRAAMSQMGQTARANEDRKFDMFMADRDAIMEKKLTPAQFAQAREQLEQHYGFDWGMPDQLAQRQAMEQEDQQLAALEQAFVFPGSDKPRMSRDQIKAWLSLGVEPKDLIGMLPKLESADVSRMKAQQDAKQGETEIEKKYGEMEADNQRTMQDIQAKQKLAEQELAMSQKKAQIDLRMQKQKAKVQAMTAYQSAVTKWGSSEGDDEARGPKPKMEDFWDESLFGDGDIGIESASGPKSISTKAEFDALQSGDEYINAKTGKRARKP
jgi:hypothetical protein